MSWVYISIAVGAAGFLSWIIIDFLNASARLKPKADMAREEIRECEMRIESEQMEAEAMKLEVEELQKEIKHYQPIFNRFYQEEIGRKLGLSILDSEFSQLMKEMFQLLQNQQLDYSNFFRDLANYQGITDCRIELRSWLDRYLKLCDRESITHTERKKKMDAVNPKYILRNHLVQRALEKALKEADFSEVTRLRVLLEKPFEDRPELFKKYNIEADFYSQDTPQEFLGRQTSCSA